jgi:hypothetical protein
MRRRQAGGEIDDPARLFPDAGRITTQYPTDSFPGHAAWLDWPWKLHRIERKNVVTFELYHLADDPQESDNLVAKAPEQTERMKGPLEAWLESVVQSLNGRDY